MLSLLLHDKIQLITLLSPSLQPFTCILLQSDVICSLLTLAQSLNLPTLAQSLNPIWLFATPWTTAWQDFLSFTISQSLLKLMPIDSVMSPNHLILCHPLLLLPSIFPASGSFPMSRLFTSGDQNFGSSASVLEYKRLISFRVRFDLPTVQGTLKSLLQHHNSKASILQFSAFFMVQLSHPYMTTGKTIALTLYTFVSKVTSLLFNTLSQFVIAFLPRSKRPLISW